MKPQFAIELPFPISVNAIWRNSRGRTHISNRYKTWKRAADNALLFRRRKDSIAPVRGSFEAVIILNKNKRRNKDCDNFIKCVLDWLERVELIENDKLCDMVTVQWGNAPGGCRVEVYPGLNTAEFVGAE